VQALFVRDLREALAATTAFSSGAGLKRFVVRRESSFAASATWWRHRSCRPQNSGACIDYSTGCHNLAVEPLHSDGQLEMLYHAKTAALHSLSSSMMGPTFVAALLKVLDIASSATPASLLQ